MHEASENFKGYTSRSYNLFHLRSATEEEFRGTGLSLRYIPPIPQISIERPRPAPNSHEEVRPHPQQ